MSRTPNELFSHLSFLTEPIEQLSVDGGLNDTIPDPAGDFLKASEYGLPTGLGDWNEEISKPIGKGATGEPEQHADGVFTETCGRQIWTYTYKDGKLVSMHVSDPELPNAEMYFDALGNEVEAGTLNPVSI